MSNEPEKNQDEGITALIGDPAARVVVVVGGTGLIGAQLVSVLQESCIVHSVSSSRLGEVDQAVKHHAIDLDEGLLRLIKWRSAHRLGPVADGTDAGR